MDSPRISVWYQHRVRATLAAVSLLAVSCGAADPPSVAPPPASASAQVNPARIDRVRGDLPAGYEVTDIAGPVAPVATWGFGAQWTANPARCGELADPAVDSSTTTGWSGSGSGGIVYAVVAASTGGLDPEAVANCAQWTVSGGRTSGTVAVAPAPTIEDAQTVATATDVTTVVEGGTETHAHAETVTAHLGTHVAFVSVVTDPGSPHPPLGVDFAATLLVNAVSALRG